MPRKAKQETHNDLLKKERLRAKELTLSEEYKNDISAYEQLEKDMSDWRDVQRALINPALKPSWTRKELYEHMEKGRRLKKNLDDLCDTILKKYSITYPFSLETLKAIAAKEIEPKGRIRHSNEVPVKVVFPEKGTCKIINSDGYEVYLNSDECFSIEINPRGSKKDILHYVSKLLDACASHGIKAETRFRDERLRDLEVYRLRALRNTYPSISTGIGISSDAAKKAYNRAYKLIHGTPYKKGAKRKIEKALLNKDCKTCDNKTCVKSGRLCPEIEAYANQDWRKESKLHGLISDFTPDKAGHAIPAKGKGSRTQGQQAFEDDER